MANVKVLVLRSPGANCDGEAHYAFQLAGASVDRLHVNRLREKPALLDAYQVLCIPGGFSYGDDVAAGKILANQLRSYFSDALQRFRDQGKLILGICNGFQVLLKAGLLVKPTADGIVPATLAHNASGKFEDRWIRMQVFPGNCPFLAGYDFLQSPVAHGEGRFTCQEAATLQTLESQGQCVLRYVDDSGKPAGYPANPNGSDGNIAGICDASGRILGLMPHPERYVLPTQHPQWTRLGLTAEPDGMRLFRNAVSYFQKW